jgi:hypothetical protein
MSLSEELWWVKSLKNRPTCSYDKTHQFRGRDTFRWNLHKEEIFTVRSMYLHMLNQHAPLHHKLDLEIDRCLEPEQVAQPELIVLEGVGSEARGREPRMAPSGGGGLICSCGWTCGQGCRSPCSWPSGTPKYLPNHLFRWHHNKTEVNN